LRKKERKATQTNDSPRKKREFLNTWEQKVKSRLAKSSRGSIQKKVDCAMRKTKDSTSCEKSTGARESWQGL